jgi:Sulfotransferase family
MISAGKSVQDVVASKNGSELPQPVFILAPPRSYTSIICTMLGQHPEAYGLPETHLFPYETVGERAKHVAQATHPMNHGLLRAVAQICFGAQTEATIHKARRWLQARSHLKTETLLEILGQRVFPRVLIDKTPSVTHDLKTLGRMHSAFPKARFIQLLRHPRGFCESTLKYLDERRKRGPLPPSHWLLTISSYPPATEHADAANGKLIDPQNGWYAVHRNISKFLESLAPEQWIRLRGEELLADPDKVLPQVAGWLGLRTDAAAIDAMKHPERSPFATFGPPGARYGGDTFFMQDPVFRPGRVTMHFLEGPLSWRQDGQGFHPDVKRLAREFGYT